MENSENKKKNVSKVNKQRKAVRDKILDIKNLLKVARLSAGLTYAKLAALSGLATSTVWRSEQTSDKGYGSCTLTTYHAIAIAIDKIQSK